MRYLFALIFPPLAVLLCGKPFQSVLNCGLTLCLYFPGALHALLVVSSHKADVRSRREIKAIEEQTRRLERAIGDGRPPVVQQVVNVTIRHPSSHVLPAEIEIDDEDESVWRPTRPALSFRWVPTAIAKAKDATRAGGYATLLAYQNLPEWAQPISWGLAAGSILSFALLAAIAARR